MRKLIDAFVSLIAAFRKPPVREAGKPFPCVTPAWKLARAKILSKRYAGVNAYHVTEDGRLIVVDCEECLYAIFSGVQDYWKIAAADRNRMDASSGEIDELKRGDSKREMTSVFNNCGKTYLGVVGFPENLDHPYISSRVTVQQLLDEIEEKTKSWRDRGGDNH